MNILLIGGNGFVGKALIKEFKKYNVKVSYLSRSQTTLCPKMKQHGYRVIFLISKI